MGKNFVTVLDEISSEGNLGENENMYPMEVAIPHLYSSVNFLVS